MKIKKLLGMYDYFFLILLAILCIFGTTIKYDNYTLPISIAATFFLIGFWLIRRRKIDLPKNFILYLIFLAVLFIHTFIFKGRFSFALLFLSGGLCWLAIYNLRSLASKLFFPFLILLGFILSGIYIISLARGVCCFSYNSLFLPIALRILHNHLGDVWAIILVGLTYKMLYKFQWWHIPVALFGSTLMIQSLSRSAIVALATGVIYIYYKSERRDASKEIITVILFLASALFIFSSIFKTTLLSRPYITEGLSSLINSPLGIGIGNFRTISKESSIAHNIMLEFVAGLGIFSAVFIAWLIRVFKSFGARDSNILFKAIFIAIFVNFLFDTTYTIPAMIWFWFSSLALFFI